MDASVCLSLPAPRDPGRVETLICFSHLQWNFVLQRPQHLMRRFATRCSVLFFEEPVPTGQNSAFLELLGTNEPSVTIVRPHVPRDWQATEVEEALAQLLGNLVATHCRARPILWFYTPMMYPFAAGVDAAAVVYDCMDELSNFRFAPPEMAERERLLMQRADVVFTGGYSIFEAKRRHHDNIHPFPSGVDLAHFATARAGLPAPHDQAGIETPVFGYYGVIDERIDLTLIATVAKARPDWSFAMIGPIAKIDSRDLPALPNIRYLGMKDYAELPAYLGGWDVALMPFAINEATRFISPTKTPEYLAGGRPVVSTTVTDVVRQYGAIKGVLIADGAEAFLSACQKALLLAQRRQAWLPAVDAILAGSSWDSTFAKMAGLVEKAVQRGADIVTRPGMPALRRGDRGGHYDYLVVGAGFAGSVLAERLASHGKRVLVCDRRNHIAGNTYDFRNEAGILVHKYGPHIFHTNSEEIFAYLSRFTRWRPYEHRVLASVEGKLLPIPINRTTLNGLYGLDLQDELAAAAFLAERAEPVGTLRTSRDVVVSQVGTHLYRTFFEGYTRKQWGLDPSELDKSVTARIPTRTSTDDRYFLDTYQAMPADGFTHLFANMLDHELVRVETGVDYRELQREGLAPRTIFTGPIDAYFDYRYGPLPYRSLEFRHETHEREWFQPVAVVNYPGEEVLYTRITEYKHLTGQTHRHTSISYEFARAEGEPYYPIPRPENQALYKKYEALARTCPDVGFVGRLGTYKYYNMDQVVGQALAMFRRMVKGDAVAA